MINKRLKKIALIVGLGIYSVLVNAQSTAINLTGKAGNIASILDLSNNPNLGFSLPNVALVSSTDQTTISAPYDGLMVYNTSASGSGLFGKGVYYWSAANTQWYYLLSSGASNQVNSVNGSSPIVVTPTTGTVVVSLQAAAGAVFVGTGGGSGVLAPGAQGTILYNDGTNTSQWLTLGANGTILASNGSIPTWTTLNALGAVTAATGTSPVSASISTGTLTISLSPNPLDVPEGGTGLASLVTNGVLYGNGASALNQTAAAAGGVMISNSTGVPAWLSAGANGSLLGITTSGAPYWEAADSVVAVNNGLTNNAGAIQLGGALVEPTSVTASGSNYAMSYDLGTGVVTGAGTGTFGVTNGGSSNPALYVKNYGQSRKVGSNTLPYGQVGIDTAAPASSAIMDINSTALGLLIPRMTTAQRNAIPTPLPNGLLIFNTDTNSGSGCYQFYNSPPGWFSIACGCTGAPGSPTFSGSDPTTACAGNSYVYSVSSVTGATGYTWQAPAGGAIISGQNSSVATILMPPTAATGTVYVYAYNSCGSSAQISLPVTINASPATPTQLTGYQTVCAGQTNVIYNVAKVSGNTYVWSIPSGTSTSAPVQFVGASQSDSITVNVSTSTVTTANSEVISVSAINNGCPSTSSASMTVTVNPTPSTPGTPTFTYTPPICAGFGNTVFTSSPNNSAATYVWSLPAGITSVSGGSTDAITTNISNTAQSGNVSVYDYYSAYPGCVSPTSSPLAVTIGPPAIPSTPVQSPSGAICYNIAYTYSVPVVTGAAHYIWTFPTGSQTTNPQTTTTNSVTVTYTTYPNCGVVTCATQNTTVSGCTSAASVGLAVTVSNTCITTYTFTGSNGAFNVPCGANQLSVELWGAGGGAATSNSTQGSGGAGAYASGTITPPAGSSLVVIVGQGGTRNGVPPAPYGGGGIGTDNISYFGGSGGGRSALQYPVGVDIVTAGAGGGGASPGSGNIDGGPGGATTGGAGTDDGGGIGGGNGGGGGTTTAGGAGGIITGDALGGAPGNQYTGGNAGGYDASGGTYYTAGGGGGGYFGGGGGESYEGSGGGGGSSFVVSTSVYPNTITFTAGHTQTNNGSANNPGNTTGNTFDGCPYISGVGVGNASSTGGNGLIYIKY